MPENQLAVLNPFPLQGHIKWGSSKQVAECALLKSAAAVLLLALVCSLQIQVWTNSWLLQPSLTPTSSSFSPVALSPFIGSSTTCVMKLSPMHSKNLLVCWCLSLWHSRRYWGGKRHHEYQSLQTGHFFQLTEESLIYFFLIIGAQQILTSVTHFGLHSTHDPKAASWLPRQNAMHSTCSLTSRTTPFLAFLPKILYPSLAT